jgi:hypothetical protein
MAHDKLGGDEGAGTAGAPKSGGAKSARAFLRHKLKRLDFFKFTPIPRHQEDDQASLRGFLGSVVVAILSIIFVVSTLASFWDLTPSIAQTVVKADSEQPSRFVDWGMFFLLSQRLYHWNRTYTDTTVPFYDPRYFGISLVTHDASSSPQVLNASMVPCDVSAWGGALGKTALCPNETLYLRTSASGKDSSTGVGSIVVLATLCAEQPAGQCPSCNCVDNELAARVLTSGSFVVLFRQQQFGVASSIVHSRVYQTATVSSNFEVDAPLQWSYQLEPNSTLTSLDATAPSGLVKMRPSPYAPWGYMCYPHSATEEMLQSIGSAACRAMFNNTQLARVVAVDAPDPQARIYMSGVSCTYGANGTIDQNCTFTYEYGPTLSDCALLENFADESATAGDFSSQSPKALAVICYPPSQWSLSMIRVNGTQELDGSAVVISAGGGINPLRLQQCYVAASPTKFCFSYFPNLRPVTGTYSSSRGTFLGVEMNFTCPDWATSFENCSAVSVSAPKLCSLLLVRCIESRENRYALQSYDPTIRDEGVFIVQPYRQWPWGSMGMQIMSSNGYSFVGTFSCPGFACQTLGLTNFSHAEWYQTQADYYVHFAPRCNPARFASGWYFDDCPCGSMNASGCFPPIGWNYTAAGVATFSNPTYPIIGLGCFSEPWAFGMMPLVSNVSSSLAFALARPTSRRNWGLISLASSSSLFLAASATCRSLNQTGWVKGAALVASPSGLQLSLANVTCSLPGGAMPMDCTAYRYVSPNSTFRTASLVLAVECFAPKAVNDSIVVLLDRQNDFALVTGNSATVSTSTQPREGVVQIGMPIFGSVNASAVGFEEARVLCSQLGFNSVVNPAIVPLPQNGSTVAVSSLACNSTMATLRQCAGQVNDGTLGSAPVLGLSCYEPPSWQFTLLNSTSGSGVEGTLAFKPTSGYDWSLFCGDQLSDPTGEVALKFCDATGTPSQTASFSKRPLLSNEKVGGKGDLACLSGGNASYCRFTYQPQGVANCSTVAVLQCVVWQVQLVGGPTTSVGLAQLAPLSGAPTWSPLTSPKLRNSVQLAICSAFGAPSPFGRYLAAMYPQPTNSSQSNYSITCPSNATTIRECRVVSAPTLVSSPIAVSCMDARSWILDLAQSEPGSSRGILRLTAKSNPSWTGYICSDQLDLNQQQALSACLALGRESTTHAEWYTQNMSSSAVFIAGGLSCSLETRQFFSDCNLRLYSIQLPGAPTESCPTGAALGLRCYQPSWSLRLSKMDSDRSGILSVRPSLAVPWGGVCSDANSFGASEGLSACLSLGHYTTKVANIRRVPRNSSVTAYMTGVRCVPSASIDSELAEPQDRFPLLPECNFTFLPPGSDLTGTCGNIVHISCLPSFRSLLSRTARFLRFTTIQVSQNPDFVRSFRSQQVTFLRLTESASFLDEAFVLTLTNQFSNALLQLFFVLDDDTLQEDRRIVNALDLVGSWWATFGAIVAIFGVYFLKHNEKKFYTVNKGWDAFDRNFVSHGQEESDENEAKEMGVRNRCSGIEHTLVQLELPLTGAES